MKSGIANHRAAPLAGAIAAVAFVMNVAAAHSADCEVRGEHLVLDKIVVRSATGDRFYVGVSDVPAIATIRGTRAPARVHVAAAVTFSGTATLVWYRLAADVVTANGMVRASAGARFLARYAVGSEVVGALVIEEGDVHEGEQKEPDEWVEGLRVPCDQLTLDARDDVDAIAEVQPPASAVWVTRRASRLGLRSKPRGGAPAVTLGRPNCAGARCLVVREIDERGAWVKVSTSNAYVHVEGWARRSELQRASEDALGRGGICTGDHATGFRGAAAWPDAGNVYQGPATVLAGTPVHTSDGGRWAAVSLDRTFQVRFRRGAGTAELIELPGIDAPIAGAVVPATRVIFPPDALGSP